MKHFKKINSMMKMLYLLLIIYIIYIIIPSCIYAKNKYIMFNHINTDNGLSHNTTTDILQDRYGFIWIGSQNGLNKFNGYDFKVYQYNMDNPNSISGNFIICLLEDSRGFIWIGTYGEGLNRLKPDTETFVHYKSDKDDNTSIGNDFILSIYEHSDGDIWVGTQNGLFILDVINNTFTQPYVESLSNQVIYKIFRDSEGYIWIATRKGVNKLNPDTGNINYYQYDPSNPNSLSGNIIRCIWEDYDGSMWFGTNNNGLNRFDKRNERFTRFKNIPSDESSLSHNYVVKVITDENNQLWVATWGGGLNLLKRDKGKFTRYRNIPEDSLSLSSDDTYDILQDRDGNIWVSTISAGVNIFQNSPYMLYSNKSYDQNSLKGNIVWVSYKDDEGIFWIGTNKGLNRYDPLKDEYTLYTNVKGDNTSISGNYIYSIYDSKDGYLWIGTNTEGLNRFDKEREVFTRYQYRMDDPDSISNNNIRTIYGTNDGYLWVGTERGGLNRLDRDNGTFKSYMPERDNPNSISHDWVTDIRKCEKGYLWVSTLGGGLNKFDIHNETFKQYYYEPNNPNSLSNNSILGMGKDDYENLWVGTTEGLNRYVEDKDIFIRYNTENSNLPDNTIRGIVRDGKGKIWFCTGKGLSSFEISTGEIINFDNSKGFPVSTSQNASYWDSSSGEILISSLNGLITFKPEKMKRKWYNPVVYITNFSTENFPVNIDKPIEFTDNISLDWNNNSFTISFAALEYSAPDHIIYQYRLNGFDKDWINSNDNRYARYTNLNGGSYTLEVRARHFEEDWVDDNNWARLKLNVETPPYFSWWAISLYSVGLMSLILGIGLYLRREQVKKVKIRDRELIRKQEDTERQKLLNQKLKELDKFKDEFLANTSHELKTPINGIIGIIESMIEGATGKLTEEQLYNLSLVASSGRRLNNLVTNLLDLSRIKNYGISLNKIPVDIKTVTDTVIKFITPTIKNKSVSIINKVKSNIPFVYGDEDRIHQIMYNLIGNAVKFTLEGEITLVAGLSGDYVKIEVSDSGVGIPEERKNDIFEAFTQINGSTRLNKSGSGLGLSISKELIELHGGKIEVSSRRGGGTKFIFTLPLCKNISLLREKESIDIENGNDYEEENEVHEQKIYDHKATIMIIDDEEINRRMLRNQLLQMNYNVVEMDSGEKAISHIEKEKPDLILLDLMLPTISGFELCKIIRGMYSSFELPIMIVTIKGNQDDINKGLNLGANDYITKPVDKTELLCRVNNAVELKRNIEELNNLKKILEEEVAVKTEESLNTNENLYISNKRLNESQKKLVNLNNSLQESERRLKAILGAVADGIWDYNIREGKVKLYSDSGYLKDIGFNLDEINVNDFDWDSLIHPDDKELLFENIKNHTLGNIDRFALDIRIRNPKNIWSWISVKGKLVEKDENSQPLRVLGVFMDIDKNKKIADDLIESKNKLKLAQELSHTGNWELDIKTNKVKWSEEVYRIYGLKPDKNYPTLEKIIEIIHPDDKPKIKRLFGNLPHSIKELKNLQFKIIKNKNEIRYLKTVVKLIRKNDEIVKVAGVLQDITELKMTEELVIKSEEKLKAALNAARQGVWDWRMDENKFYWNEKWNKLIGLNENKFVNEPNKLLDFVHPDDKDKIKQALNTISNNENDLLKCEYRFVIPSGDVIWVLAMGKVFERNDKGLPIRMVGTISDITEQKKDSEKLRNSLLEKEILLKEIHHRVKNNLQIISSLINLQSRYVHDERILNIFMESRLRIHSMALIHESLYQSDSLAKINFYNYVKTLTQYLFHSYELNSKITYEIDVEENICLDINISVPCGLIINELVSNSFKYAFPKEFNREYKGKVIIKFSKEPNGDFLLTISDNGIGLPDNIKEGKPASLGLNLVRILVNQLDGEMDIIRGKGTKYEIRFNENSV